MFTKKIIRGADNVVKIGDLLKNTGPNLMGDRGIISRCMKEVTKNKKYYKYQAMLGHVRVKDTDTSNF